MKSGRLTFAEEVSEELPPLLEEDTEGEREDGTFNCGEKIRTEDGLI